MDPVDRRRALAASPRLIAILGANLAALTCLGWVLFSGGGEPAPDGGARSGQVAAAGGEVVLPALDAFLVPTGEDSVDGPRAGAAGSPVAESVAPMELALTPPLITAGEVGRPGAGPAEDGTTPTESARSAEGEPSQGELQPAKPVSGATPGSTPGSMGGPGPSSYGAIAQLPAGETQPPASMAQADARLRRRIEAAISEATTEASRRSKGKVSGSTATVALSVVDVATGAVRVARLDEAPLRPASVQKLVTVSAALLQLGVDHTIETPVLAAGEVRAGVLEGDLVLRAAGDPLYDSAARGAIDPWAEQLSEQLRAAGIRRVRGALVLDEGSFADPGPGPAWPGQSSWWQEYCAFAGGFSVNGGCFTAIVTPRAAGQKASVWLRPVDHGLQPRVGVSTSRGGRNDVRVGATATTVTVGGSIPAGVAPFEARFSHPDPVALFGTALLGGLRRAGIEVEGGVARRRSAATGAPEVSREVARLRSPLAPIIVPILRDSNNSLADQVFLHLGLEVEGEGSRSGGSRAVRAGLEELDVPTKGIVCVGGSGLSRDNRLTARAVTSLLRELAIRGGETHELVLEALPLSGVSGTLESRMREGSVAHRKVRAKTGFINGTSALAGYAETEGGGLLAFALLVSYPHADALNTHCWKPMGNAICEALVESDR